MKADLTRYPTLAKALEVEVPWHELKIARVYENPTEQEFVFCVKRGDCRAFLVGTDRLIVWPPFDATHNDVSKSLDLPKDAIPVYLYAHSGTVHAVAVSDLSKRGPWHHNPKVADAIRANKPLKEFSHHTVDVNYYDGDIVGPWENLKTSEKPQSIQLV